MKYNLDQHERYTVIKLEENRLNSIISPELKTELVVLNGQGVKNIIIDLSQIQYCDSSGLSAILVGNRLCKNSNGSLVLIGLQDAVKRLISISQLEQILLTAPTVSEGVDMIFMEEIERDLEKEN